MSNEEKGLTTEELDALWAELSAWLGDGAAGGTICFDCEFPSSVRTAAPRLIAMARRATSSGEWLSRMAEAVGYTEHAHPADVLQRIDDAVSAEARGRELEDGQQPDWKPPSQDDVDRWIASIGKHFQRHERDRFMRLLCGELAKGEPK